MAKNPAYRRELIELGHRSVPVTIIGDRHIVGFDPEALKEALNL